MGYASGFFNTVDNNTFIGLKQVLRIVPVLLTVSLVSVGTGLITSGSNNSFFGYRSGNQI